MEDRLTNMIIAVIFIIVLGLAGIYAYKIIEGKAQTALEPNIQVENFTKKNESIDTKNTGSNQNTSQEQTSSASIVIPLTETNTHATKTDTKTQTTVATLDTYSYNNRFYYNQLNTYSKAIYDSIIKNIDKLKTGNSKINIDYDFSKILNDKTEKSKLEIYYGDAINAVNLDLPNLFYIDFSKFSLNVESETSIFGTKHSLYIDSGKNPNYFQDSFSNASQVEQAINDVETIKSYIIENINNDDYTKIKYLHDWMIDNLEYNSSSVNKGTVYGALFEKQAVCEGYARAYKYLLDSVGINSILVTGTATNSSGNTEEHMWNYVKLDDNWYAVDCTWDDPIVYGGGTIGYEVKHRFFLIGSVDLSVTHVAKKTISPNGKTFTLPILSINKY